MLELALFGIKVRAKEEVELDEIDKPFVTYRSSGRGLTMALRPRASSAKFLGSHALSGVLVCAFAACSPNMPERSESLPTMHKPDTSLDHDATASSSRLSRPMAPTVVPKLERVETVVGVPKLERVETIAVVPQPVCDWEQKGSDAERLAFLKQPRVQRAVFAIGEAIARHQSSYIDTLFDPLQKRVVIVLHTDFSEYQALQQDLARKVIAVDVELSPACRTRDELARAERVLTERQWHPKAQETPMAWWLEGAFSAFSVVIEESAPDVAEALERKLGPLVRVSLGRPRLHSGAGKP